MAVPGGGAHVVGFEVGAVPMTSPEPSPSMPHRRCNDARMPARKLPRLVRLPDVRASCTSMVADRTVDPSAARLLAVTTNADRAVRVPRDEHLIDDHPCLVESCHHVPL